MRVLKQVYRPRLFWVAVAPSASGHAGPGVRRPGIQYMRRGCRGSGYGGKPAEHSV